MTYSNVAAWVGVFGASINFNHKDSKSFYTYYLPCSALNMAATVGMHMVRPYLPNTPVPYLPRTMVRSLLEGLVFGQLKSHRDSYFLRSVQLGERDVPTEARRFEKIAQVFLKSVYTSSIHNITASMFCEYLPTLKDSKSVPFLDSPLYSGSIAAFKTYCKTAVDEKKEPYKYFGCKVFAILSATCLKEGIKAYMLFSDAPNCIENLSKVILWKFALGVGEEVLATGSDIIARKCVNALKSYTGLEAESSVSVVRVALKVAKQEAFLAVKGVMFGSADSPAR